MSAVLVKARVTPNAKQNAVCLKGSVLKVRVTAPAVAGRANAAAVRAVAQHFKVKPNRVRLVRGEKQKDKIFEVRVDVFPPHSLRRRREVF